MARKNPHAVALGKLGGPARIKSMTAEEREAFHRAGGKKGGPARAEKLSEGKRKEIAQKGAQARWAKAKKKAKKG
jgi:hypothetical protein